MTYLKKDQKIVKTFRQTVKEGRGTVNILPSTRFLRNHCLQFFFPILSPQGFKCLLQTHVTVKALGYLGCWMSQDQ